jgi:membrane-bound lytic murein transglycosylase A
MKHVKGYFWISLLFFFFGMGLHGCHRWFHVEVKDPKDALVLLEEDEIPAFSDDLDMASLSRAVQGSLRYLKRLPKDRSFIYGPDTYSALEVIRSMETFLALLDRYSENTEEMWRRVSTHFKVYRAVGRDGAGEVLYTGYYEPIIDGRLEPDEIHTYPIYGRPKDLIQVDLGLFKESLQGERIVARYEQGSLFPYYNREEIDSRMVLSGRGLEIAWARDPVEIFFLQIQGSGQIRLPDGERIRVNYAATNGRPYRSIGRLLIEQGLMDRDGLSMQKLKAFLDAHPEMRTEILNHNESYIFFRLVDEGPLGNIEVPLTSGRSIATDYRLFPKGALTFIRTKKPVFDHSKEIESWVSLNRFALNQDTGGAIRGPGRVDLFFGNGELAELSAGHMNQTGELYFFMQKPSTVKSGKEGPRDGVLKNERPHRPE